MKTGVTLQYNLSSIPEVIPPPTNCFPEQFQSKLIDCRTTLFESAAQSFGQVWACSL
jgi:hypothetical protein